MSEQQPEETRSADTTAGPPGGRKAILEVDHVTLRFGGVVALNEVDFAIYEGEIWASSVPTVRARPPASTR